MATARKPPRANSRKLATYQQRRDFAQTPEPAGAVTVSDPAHLSYVIQKHAARRLHYDFRLELDGVLLSWACPKGPSLDPGEKRLAVRTEDHPLEYGGFEGVIPKGKYGGGTVMLWDYGEWEPTAEPHAGLRKGHLSFVLHGKRLQGAFNLIKIKATKEQKEDAWLLIKGQDENAQPGRGTQAVEAYLTSVDSDRSMEQIAAGENRIWTRAGELPGRRELLALPGAVKAEIPWPLAPQLPTLVNRPADEAGWLHELKLDGYRLLARIHKNGKVQLYTRGAQDWTARLGVIAQAIAQLPVGEAVIDGELVALDARGRSSFSALQRAIEAEPQRLYFYAFDLLQAQGVDLRAAPLRLRKQMLQRILAAGNERIRYNDHVAEQGKRVHARACDLEAEGIVSKRMDAPYRSGRSRDWLKIKCLGREEFAVGGYITRTENPLASLLLGRMDKGELVYVGRVGTGFAQDDYAVLKKRLGKLLQKEMPFAGDKPPMYAGDKVHWVKPEILVEVKFSGWTHDNILRHASFQGIREDKPSPAILVDAAVRVSHPDKVFYPETGLTKGQLAAWTALMAPWILPHVAGRPLMLMRCPDGHTGGCFYQKHYDNMPEHIYPVRVPGYEQPFIEIKDVAGLIALIQTGVLEVHPWGARSDRPDLPDRVIFDLDPAPELPFETVVHTALDLRRRLEDIGLRSWPRWSGGKGLHVVVPLVRRQGWDEIKQFARGVAQDMVRDEPARYIAKASKEQRTGKIFVDWLRNGFGATAIASWWFRARPGAPVAVPLQWSELDPEMDLTPYRVPEVQPPTQDPWVGFFDCKQTLTAIMLRKVGINKKH
ncbi:MAG TPA: DNA ligase D [Gammaproteobacteria bacterium]